MLSREIYQQLLPLTGLLLFGSVLVSYVNGRKGNRFRVSLVTVILFAAYFTSQVLSVMASSRGPEAVTLMVYVQLVTAIVAFLSMSFDASRAFFLLLAKRRHGNRPPD